MIEAGEVGAVFAILDRATPNLRKIAAELRTLDVAVERSKAKLESLGLPIKSAGLFAGITDQLARLDARIAATRKELTGIGAPFGGLGIKADFDALKTNIGEIAAAARRAGTAISQGFSARRLSGAVSSSAAIAANFERAAIAAGRLGGSGILLPPGGRYGAMRHGGGGGGGAHIGGPSIGMPGGAHMRLPGGLAMGAAAMVGYGVYEESEMQDAIFQLMYHSGQKNTAENRKNFRNVLQKSMSESGYGLHDISEAAKTEMRMFKGTPGGGLDVMPEMLRAATIEARLKGSSVEESMNSLIGLAHMTKQYDAEAIKKLAPAFAFMSASNPSSLSSMERAAGYAVPILQSNMDIDPMSTLLMGTVLTRAGITSTKSGTWLRNMVQNALPGTSLMSQQAYKKHEESLRKLGLIDDKDQPTWMGDDGKPDVFKLLEIGSQHAAGLSMTDKGAAEKALFGVQGEGAFAILSDPAIRKQIDALKSEMNSEDFKERYSTFSDQYSDNSPVQKARQTFQDLTNVLMDIGTTVLPPVVKGLSDLDEILKGFSWLFGFVGKSFDKIMPPLTPDAENALKHPLDQLKKDLDRETKGSGAPSDGDPLKLNTPYLPFVPMAFHPDEAFSNDNGRGPRSKLADIFDAATEDGVLSGLIKITDSAKAIIASWFGLSGGGGAVPADGGGGSSFGGLIQRASFDAGGGGGSFISDGGGSFGGRGGGRVGSAVGGRAGLMRRARGFEGSASGGGSGGGYSPLGPGSSTYFKGDQQSRVLGLMDRLVNVHGWTPEAAAIAAGNAVQESNVTTGAIGDGGQSIGMFQWNHGRLAALRAFGGANWQNPNIQADFMAQEAERMVPGWKSVTNLGNAGRISYSYEGFANKGEMNPGSSRMRSIAAAMALWGSRGTSAKGGGKTPFDLVFGDSIGSGMQSLAGAQGVTKVGMGPNWVLNQLRAHAGEFDGKRVLLSSGISNNPTDLAGVRSELEFLQSQHAKISLMGAGPKFGYLNPSLQALAKQYGAGFTPLQGPFDPLGVHPNYRATMAGVNFSSATGGPDPSAEAERERRRAAAMSSLHAPAAANGGREAHVTNLHLDGKRIARAVSKHTVAMATHPRQAPFHDAGHLYSSADYGFATG